VLWRLKASQPPRSRGMLVVRTFLWAFTGDANFESRDPRHRADRRSCSRAGRVRLLPGLSATTIIASAFCDAAGG
jgi:hypothetical protein